MWEHTLTREGAIGKARRLILSNLAGVITRTELAHEIHKVATDAGCTFADIRDAAVESLDPGRLEQ